jgi:hypothetical protein
MSPSLTIRPRPTRHNRIGGLIVATVKTVAKGCGISLAVLALILASWFVGGFLLMVLAGALYGSFGWLAPIGILPATGIYVVGSILMGLLRRGKRA